jgi:DNA-3-methyladenine glycosylase II
MDYFKYGQDEISFLKKKDKKLGLAIDRIGMIKREVIPDKFTAFVTCIVGQQISNKAAETVWNRLCELLKEITPQTIADVDMESIQKCGMSVRKANYIKGIGEAVINGELDFAKFDDMFDDEIIKKLSTLRGVGVWTAEMLLIFSMERTNVLSWDDLAIRRGIMNLYGLKELTKPQFERYKKRYSPFGTVASLYLWVLSCE